MISQSHEHRMNNASGEWIDAIERLLRWIGPRTAGRERVLQRMEDIKKVQRETHRLRDDSACSCASSTSCIRQAP